jgi:predicted RNase H-like nuclease (RuvC/YqgF family)
MAGGGVVLAPNAGRQGGWLAKGRAMTASSRRAQRTNSTSWVLGAAVQALHRKIRELEAENEALRVRSEELRAELAQQNAQIRGELAAMRELLGCLAQSPTLEARAQEWAVRPGGRPHLTNSGLRSRLPQKS